MWDLKDWEISPFGWYSPKNIESSHGTTKRENIIYGRVPWYTLMKYINIQQQYQGWFLVIALP